ncbi:MAG: NUDIX hydrolase [Synergistaceae bacterium]|jgi:ADP-ribose pyrophosphatase|nr:NUDIX hydrolase [Synergistaceae bacterium]
MERVLTSRRVYDGHVASLRVDEVEMPSGRRTTREVVEHCPAVCVLALTEKDSVLLVRQFRYAAGEETLEVCAGLVEKGENLEEAAVREMQEELGYFPGDLRELGSFYVSPGYCTEMLTLFLARDLKTSSLPQDDDEDVRRVEVAYEEIPALLAKGCVRDAKTIVALSWLMAWKGLKPQTPF